MAAAGRASAAPTPPAAASSSASRRLSLARLSELGSDIRSPLHLRTKIGCRIQPAIIYGRTGVPEGEEDAATCAGRTCPFDFPPKRRRPVAGAPGFAQGRLYRWAAPSTELRAGLRLGEWTMVETRLHVTA